MGFSFVLVLTVLSFSINIVLALELAPTPLPSRLYPSTKRVTVSGGGNGGVMAQMMHFAHSKYIKGCGAFSPGLYRCGPPNGIFEDFKALCTKYSSLPREKQHQVHQVVSELHSSDTTHLIDSLQNLRYSRLYVYCALKSPIYRPDQQLDVVALYEHYLSTPYSIYTRVQDESALMRVIDMNEKPECPTLPQADATVSPNCTSMSVPAEALGFILGGSSSTYINPFYPYMRYVNLGPLRSFNQTEFTVGLDKHDFDDVGYFYVPRYCEYRNHAQRYGYGHRYGRPCEVHVYFHGCGQGREFLGTSHVIESNFLEIAELNYIIMLFPQVLSSKHNPSGCWDVNGRTGMLYATKDGLQINAVWRMLERLLYLMPEKTTSHIYTRPSRDSTSDNNYKFREEHRGNCGENDNKCMGH